MIHKGLMLAAALFLSAGIPSPSLAQIDGKNVPPDFKIFARYYPGYSSRKAWKATITAEGKVAQDVLNEETLAWDRKELRTLARQDVIDLMTKLETSGFFELKPRYDYPVTDNPTIVLIVTRDGQTKEVSIYAPGFVKDKDAVKRFLSVWSEVLKKVPSPNGE